MISRLLKPFAHVPRVAEFDETIAAVVDPDYVVIPLEYPGQILYKPLVSAGGAVYKNQIIGRSAMGNCVHASISGVVKEIKPVWTARSFNVPAVVIERNDKPPLSVEEVFEQYGVRFESATRVQQLKACGVISPWTLAGRFHHEESSDDLPEVKHVVIKGVNEEPSIFAFELLLKEKVRRVQSGIRRLKNIAPNAAMWLTVPGHMKAWAQKEFGDTVTVVDLPDQYKGRIERLVVPRLTGIDVPNTVPYRAKGVAVISVEYLLALADALDRLGPFVVKHLTIASSNGFKATTVACPLGTTVKTVLASLKLDCNDYGRVLVGGPMKGNAQFTEDTPLTKSSHGIYLLAKDAIPEEVNLTCINCGRCTRACPVKLQVHLIGRCVEHGFLVEARKFHPDACNECGLCTYVCPAHRPLVQLIQMCNRYDEVLA